MEKIAFVFAGQGAQRPGMGKDLAACAVGRRSLARLREEVGEAFPEQLWEGSPEDLKRTALAQPALFWQGYTLARLLLDAGLRPAASCGLSLGEYTALCTAGGLSYEAGLALVKRRGALMGAAVAGQGGGMLALAYGDVHALTRLLEDFNQSEEAARRIYISNLNCPGQIVVAGHLERLEELRPALLELGVARVFPLAVEGAFHSPLMDEAALAFKEILDTQSFSPTQWPVYSNYHAENPGAGEWPQVLYEQLRSTVRLEACLRRLLRDGVEHFVEIGPGSVIAGCLKKIDRGLRCSPVQDLDGALALGRSLGLAIEV